MTPTARPKSKAARRSRRRPSDRHSLSAQLLDVIAARGVIPANLARDAGVNATMIRRFVAGERDVTLGTADRLASALGLRLVEVGRGKARARPARGTSSTTPDDRPGDPAGDDES